MYLGGGSHGERLNRMYLENIGERHGSCEELDNIARPGSPGSARDGERFGDFTIRAGYVREVKEGRDFND